MDFDSLMAENTKAELYDMADTLNIEGRSGMSKADLAKAILEADQPQEEKFASVAAVVPVVSESIPPLTPWRKVRTDLHGNIIPNPFE